MGEGCERAKSAVSYPAPLASVAGKEQSASPHQPFFLTSSSVLSCRCVMNRRQDKTTTIMPDQYKTKCPSKHHNRDLAIKLECRWCGEKLPPPVLGKV